MASQRQPGDDPRALRGRGVALRRAGDQGAGRDAGRAARQVRRRRRDLGGPDQAGLDSARARFRKTLDHIVFNDLADGEAIAELCRHCITIQRLHFSICRVKDDFRLGGVIFSHYTGESIAIHTAVWTRTGSIATCCSSLSTIRSTSSGLSGSSGRCRRTTCMPVNSTSTWLHYVARVEGVFPGQYRLPGHAHGPEGLPVLEASDRDTSSLTYH